MLQELACATNGDKDDFSGVIFAVRESIAQRYRETVQMPMKMIALMSVIRQMCHLLFICNIFRAIQILEDLLASGRVTIEMLANVANAQGVGLPHQRARKMNRPGKKNKSNEPRESFHWRS